MQVSAIRRIVSLLVALAFLAGLQMAAMPIAAADVTASKVAGQTSPDTCKACGTQAMTAGECTAVCTAVPGLLGHVASVTPSFNRHHWTWPSENTPATAVQPDLSPPRS